MCLVPFKLCEVEEFLRAHKIELDRKQILELYMVVGGISHYLGMVKNFNLLADSDHPEAEYNIEQRYRMIGYCYSDGFGIQKNHEKAMFHFKLAAELGDAE